MYQTPRAFEHHPRLENLFDPAARSVLAGASSPPGPCRQTPVRARVIEHAFEVREAPTPPDMSAFFAVQRRRVADDWVRFARLMGFAPASDRTKPVTVGAC